MVFTKLYLDKILREALFCGHHPASLYDDEAYKDIDFTNHTFRKEWRQTTTRLIVRMPVNSKFKGGTENNLHLKKHQDSLISFS